MKNMLATWNSILFTVATNPLVVLSKYISLNIKTKIAERYEIKRQNERKFCQFQFLKKNPDVCFLAWDHEHPHTDIEWELRDGREKMYPSFFQKKEI